MPTHSELPPTADEPCANDAWIRETLCRLVAGSPSNRLTDFGGQAIFDRPVVGVADGDDPAFMELRRVVSERHRLPREMLDCAAGDKPVGAVRVVCWALPFTHEVRVSNRAGEWPSALYSVARNNGGALGHEVWNAMAARLRERGWLAVAPELEAGYTAYRAPEHVFTSTWSERHAAWVAGLGRFGLSRGLITPLGVNVRFGSVVTDLPLTVTPRPDDEWRGPCVRDGGRSCGRCIARCPVGAISAQGMDKSRCNEMRLAVQERFTREYGGTFDLQTAPIATQGKTRHGFSLGCALCQCGVPCEGGIPMVSTRDDAVRCST